MKVSMKKTLKVGWMIDYNEDKVEKNTATRIGGNVSGSRERLETTMNYFSYQRPTGRIKNRFIHLKLSLHPGQKNVSSRLLRQLGEETIKRLGYVNNPFTIYRHHDTDHQHIHIVLSRVTFDGKLIRDCYDGLKLRRIEQNLAKEFELISSHDRLLSDSKVRGPQKWEAERMQQQPVASIKTRLTKSEKGHRSLRNYVQTSVMESLVDNPSETVFLARLERRGVKLTRHKFERKGNTFYGISYTVIPELAKAYFESTESVRQLAGIVGNQKLELGKISSIDHPYFGKINASVQLNAKGIPELCPENSKPVKQLKPISFRAGNLGPFFQHENLLKLLDLKPESAFADVTIQRKRNVRNEKFVTKVLTENEDSLLASLILASEMRSEDRVIESIRKGASLRKAISEKSLISLKDAAFLELVGDMQPENLQTLKSKPGKQKAQDSSNDMDYKLRQILSKYSATSQTITAPTQKLLMLISENKWEEVSDFLKQAIKLSPHLAPDADALKVSLVPAKFQMEMFDYAEWYKDQLIGRRVEDFRSQKEIDTAKLAAAIEQNDLGLIQNILATASPDVAKIPMRNILRIGDMSLMQTLVILHTGKMVNKENIAEVVSKPDQLSEDQIRQILKQDVNNNGP